MDFQKIPLDLVKPSPMNPRKTFDEEAVKELAANIEKQGLIQPITVRPYKVEMSFDAERNEPIVVDDGYEIVCGERRYRAFCQLKAKEDELNQERVAAHRKKSDQFQSIPAIIREMNDDEAFENMIAENLQRQDVDPMEEAFAFGQLIEKGKTVEEIALKFGKSIRFVQDRVKLNSLIPELMLAIKEDKMSISAAMIICKLDEEMQRKYYSQYSNNYQGLSKSTAESFINYLFMNLSKAPWYSSDNQADEDFDGGCGRKCSECQYNTSNHGCLFWEMKSQDGGRCTNREQFQSKILAYMLKTIDEYADELILKDQPLTFGKIVIGNNPDEYYSENSKPIREAFIAEIERRGYEIVNHHTAFDSKCWYDADDERIAEKRASGEIYRVLTISGYDMPEVVEAFYYVKKNDPSVNSGEDGMPMSVSKLLNDYKYEKETLPATFTVEECKTISEQSNIKDLPPLDAKEIQLILSLMLSIDHTARKELGLGDGPSDEALRKCAAKPDAMPYIMRSWLRFMLKTGGMTVSASIDRTRKIAEPYLEDLGQKWCPEEFQKTKESVQAKFDKKVAKIEKSLKKLGYGLDGKKIVEVSQPNKPAKSESKLRKKYAELKEQHPDSIILFKVARDYIAIGDDVNVVHETLKIAMGQLPLDGNQEMICGFAHSDIDEYLPKLIRAGKRVCICDNYRE